jgi:ankyrin repeat protein
MGEINEAIKKGNFAKVSSLIESNPELLKSQSWWGRETLLHQAVGFGKADIVSLLLSKGASVHAKDRKGRTPLDALFRLDDSVAVSIAELLLDKGANVNEAANGGTTPLHSASIQKQGSLAEMLVAHGANVNARNSAGVTPLHCAALRGSTSIVLLLLRAGAEVNPKGTIGKFYKFTPRDMAVKMSTASDAGSGYSAVIEILERAERLGGK